MLRVDLKGKVEEMIPETLKSIIQQNYLSSVGDEVTLKRLISPQINCTNPQGLGNWLDGGRLRGLLCELGVAEDRHGELHLRGGGQHLDQPFWKGGH